jgi:hypothetical protein
VTTTWTWDTAANGVGKLHKLTSPDGEKENSCNRRGQLESLAFSVSGANTILEGKLDYDEFARVATITYPTPAGAAPFVITQDYDPYGHVLKVHDDVTDYWHLQDVDNAGLAAQGSNRAPSIEAQRRAADRSLAAEAAPPRSRARSLNRASPKCRLSMSAWSRG